MTHSMTGRCSWWLLVSCLMACANHRAFRPAELRPAPQGAQDGPQDPPFLPASRPAWQPPPPADGWTPVELSLAYGAQLAGADHDVYGLRLGLVSAENHAVYGLDFTLGMGEQAAGGGGLSIGLVRNVTGGDFTGMQFALGRNEAEPRTHPDAAVLGLQIAVLANQASRIHGIQASLVNLADVVCGVQLGLVEGAEHLNGIAIAGLLSYTDVGAGLQIAPFNVCSRTFTGAQIGLFNLTGKGFQLGLINVNENGFLPVFPIVNF